MIKHRIPREGRLVTRLTMSPRCCILWVSLLLTLPALAALEDNTILALDPQQGMVVVKTAAGKLEVIRVGDTFPGSDLVVKQVLADKVIAEEVVGEDNKAIQQVWIYKAENAGAGSRVERLLLSLPDDGTLIPRGTGLKTRTMVLDPPGESQ